MTSRHPNRGAELLLQICFEVQKEGPGKNYTLRVRNIHMVFEVMGPEKQNRGKYIKSKHYH